MSSPTLQAKSMAIKHLPPVAALISPPDELLDSFSQPSSPAAVKPSASSKIHPMADSKGSRPAPSHHLASLLTPQSPTIQSFELPDKFRTWSADFSNGRTGAANPDPILYPDRRSVTEYNSLFAQDLPGDDQSATPPPVPRHADLRLPSLASLVTLPPQSIATPPVTGIFTKRSVEEALKEEIVEQHRRARVGPQYVQSKSKATRWSSPKPHEYRLMMEMALQAKVMHEYNKDPIAYLKRQRDENEENFRVAKRQRSGGVSSATILKPKESKPVTATVAHPPRVRKAPRKQIDRSGTPEVKHRRAPAKKQRVDYNYNDVPDYTPPLDTLLAGKTFRVKWDGHALDLSKDPNKHLLHPAELQLASSLRFPVDQYLKTKRRLFVGRVNSYIKSPHKQFGKTDAQQVGGVDVNKLSQLWEAYNGHGWFDVTHVKQHAEMVRNTDQIYDPKNTKWVDRKDFFGF